MDQQTRQRIAEVLGAEPEPGHGTPLSGGCIADVARIRLADGRSVVIKRDTGSNPRLDLEGRMLADLAETDTVRTPEVFLAAPDLLVLEHIENDGARSSAGGAAFAETLAALHAVTADRFGYETATLIGPLDQPNPRTETWPAFYADHRVRAMASLARDRGGISPADADRLDRLCAHMPDLIGEPPPRPALIHGDLWAGNVLWNGGSVAAVIDPAIHFADPEVELAFIDLMGCFDRSFYDAYDRAVGIRPGFWESRRDLYTLYPLLVHAALFGGGYGASAMAVATRLGF